jgi:predicted transcriptional regulator
MEDQLVTDMGKTAGEVWTLLKKEGPLSLAKVVKGVNRQRDLVMQSLGWLAREGKITIREEGRVRRVSLK